MVGYQIHAGSHTGLKVAAATGIDLGGLVFGVRKDWPHMRTILDKALLSITPEEKDRIRQQWFAVRFEHGVDMARVRQTALKVALAAVAVFALVLFWNRQIRRREERFRCLTEHGSDLIQAVRATGTLVYASPSHATVLGYPVRKIRGKKVFDLIHTDDRDRFKALLASLGPEKSQATAVLRFTHFNGHALVFEAHCTDLTRNKALKALVINARDITAQEQAKEEMTRAKEAAEAANQGKTDFLAGLSHEVRTPLNAILGMAKLTLKTQLDKGQAKNLRAVLSSARYLREVINDILDFSTLEAGKMKIHNRRTDLTGLLENLAYTWGLEARKKGLAFELAVSDALAPDSHASCPAFHRIHTDPVRLAQILINLLSNAIKFTHKGKITLSAAPETTDGREFIRFTVIDTGIGIAKDQLEGIFDRFTQARGPIARDYGGTGLGLAICREMAGLLGGSLTVASTPGQGSCFSLMLPHVPAREGAGDTLDQIPELMVPQGMTLILAEDDPMNQSVFREMTAKSNCEVIFAQDGYEVLAALKAHAVDLVFMDIEMPRMDGLSATQQIRAGRAGEGNRRVPVVAMTAHVLAEYREKAMAAGMNDFLPKPVEWGRLQALLTRYAPAPGPPDPFVSIDHPQPAGPAPEVVVDHDKGLASLGGNTMLLEKIYSIFITETPALVSALEAVLEDGAPDSIALAAHTLKGAGGRVYAVHAAEAAAALEALARQDSVDPEKITIQAHETLRAFEKVIECLHARHT